MKKYAVITMDVEDWYHTYFPEADVDRSISLLDGLDVALEIMRKENIKGSFFVVAEIAEMLAKKFVLWMKLVMILVVIIINTFAL